MKFFIIKKLNFDFDLKLSQNTIFNCNEKSTSWIS